MSKQTKDFDKDYKDRIKLIVSPLNDTDTQELKMLIPKNYKISHLVGFLRKNGRCTKDKAIYFYTEKNSILKSDIILYDLYSLKLNQQERKDSLPSDLSDTIQIFYVYQDAMG